MKHSRLISGIFKDASRKISHAFLTNWMAPDDIRRHLQANLIPKYSVITTKHKITYQGIARLDLYFLEATGFSPFSFHGVIGQDNILTNNTINKPSAKD